MMALLTGPIGWVVTKLLGSFGMGALKQWTGYLQSKDYQFTKRWAIAAQSEVELKTAAMQYRLGLLNNPLGMFLIGLIVIPPSLHWALVWFDTIWISFGGTAFGIEKAPPGYDTLGINIMLAFIGMGTAAGLSSVVMKGIKGR